MHRSRASALPAQEGISLPEILVVIAILGLAVMVSVPLIADRIHDAKLRSSVSEFAVSLRAARMVAVSRRAPVTVTVVPEPDNTYEYTDAGGRERLVRMPPGVRIGAGSTAAISFGADGSLADTAMTILETTFSDQRIERWRVETPISGIPRVYRLEE